MSEKKKLSEQVAVIERVCEETGLSYNDLADVVVVSHETMRKISRGYQPAGERLLESIRNVPHLPSIRARLQGKKVSLVPETPAPQRATGGSPLAQRLAFVLANATQDEQQIVTSVINSAFRQISKRVSGESGATSPSVGAGNIIHIPVGYRLRAVLGDIAAGIPQEAISQADQWVPVEPKYAKDTTFALRVRGDSMVDKGIEENDIVYINAKREPRNGDIVAALCDHETTLKTFVVKGRETPFLRSENKAFPPKIIPVQELTIQGVMIAKHRKP